MPKIISVPIEPLESRYSKQWDDWFTTEFAVKGIPFEVVYGTPLTTTIENGAFLDVCGTNYYKASQLQILCKMIHTGKITSGDTILLHDAWFPGVEMLAYMRDGLGVNFKIVGCFHAGTYDPTDFISKKGMGLWGEALENSWFRIYDACFVATNYHKQLILKNRVNAKDTRIHVTGFPINFCDNPKPKEKIVVFPHRLTDDKQPFLFDSIASYLKMEHPDWTCIKTQAHSFSKKHYYDFLATSSIVVSFALHENWGIAVQEAIMLDNIPILPNRLSYKEMYPKQYRYDTIEDFIELLSYTIGEINKGNQQTLIDGLKSTKIKLASDGYHAIPNMLEVIWNLN